MTRAALVAVVAVGFGLSAAALGFDGRLGLGTVGMVFLSSQLEGLASREGATFSPLRFAWDAGVDVWPWPFAGVGVIWLQASGTTHGREPQRQSASALGLQAQAATSWSLFGWPIGAEVGIGGYLVSASGLVTGSGLALGGHAGVEWRFFEWGPVQAVASLVWRHLPAKSLYGARGEVNTRGRVAVDFSGLYIGIAVGWK